ncbi:MAG TPA: peroxiredoxin [Phenylobacterium sp.]|nr:peroxiredoxin [Phenylobacterium sp.]
MIRSLALGLALTAVAAPAFAALKVGAKAPDFSTAAFQAGKQTSFSLAEARRKGPVVVFFFPAAYTGGCNLEAKAFADAMDQFTANGATVIGVTAGNADRLAEFSNDTKTCSGKFKVAADPGLKIASGYDAKLALKPGWTDRTSYVVAPDGKVLMAYSNLKPDEHVTHTLAAVKQWKAGKKK